MSIDKDLMCSFQILKPSDKKLAKSGSQDSVSNAFDSRRLPQAPEPFPQFKNNNNNTNNKFTSAYKKKLFK